MKVSIVRGGGVGGLLTRTELDSAALPAGDPDKLAEAAQRALAAPEAPAVRGRSTDELLYTVTVRDEEGERTLSFSEATLPEPVRELIAWVDSRPERKDRIEPPGGGA